MNRNSSAAPDARSGTDRSAVVSHPAPRATDSLELAMQFIDDASVGAAGTGDIARVPQGVPSKRSVAGSSDVSEPVSKGSGPESDDLEDEGDVTEVLSAESFARAREALYRGADDTQALPALNLDPPPPARASAAPPARALPRSRLPPPRSPLPPKPDSVPPPPPPEARPKRPLPSFEEITETLEARMEEILKSARTFERNPRATITPDRMLTDAAGQQALSFLRNLGRQTGNAGLEMKDTIGEGGMGIVRAANQRALGREVAVKTVKDEVRNDATTLKLLREAWVTGALEHPNVVPVYDITIDAAGSPLIVLKRIAGAPWSELMRDEKRIRQKFHARDPFEWNLRILAQVCNAIHFAHSRSIVHRDLKPDNVMIGEFGEVYVLDWGIAVAMSDDGTGRLPLAKDATEIAGTPAYMAPEMLGGRYGTITPRTDVYLLGSILFEIVTGSAPHDATELMEIFTQVARSSPKLPKDIPEELVRIIRRAMDPDPDARFENAEQLRLAVTAFLEHRGSVLLSEEARVRLDELDLERREATDDPDGKRMRLYNLYGECRFGFLEAIRTWRGNDDARVGLRQSIRTMIEFELEDGDPKAASLLLSELEDPSSELAERVNAARRLLDEEQDRRAAIARDHDLSIGRNARIIALGLMGLAWTIARAVTWWYEQTHPTDGRHPLYEASVLVVVAGGLALWSSRNALGDTLINRRILRLVGIVIAAQFLFFFAAWILQIRPEQTRPLLLLIYAVCSAMAAATIDGSLWPTALAQTASFAASCIWPQHTFWFEAAAHSVLSLNVFGIWMRQRKAATDREDGRASMLPPMRSSDD